MDVMGTGVDVAPEEGAIKGEAELGIVETGAGPGDTV